MVISLDSKAQLHTMEGVAAAGLILLSIIFSLQAAAITPLTSSAADLQVESQLRILGYSLLSTLDQRFDLNGSISNLKIFLLRWGSNTSDSFNWFNNTYVSLNNSSLSLDLVVGSIELSAHPKLNFTQLLNQTLIRRGLAHNLDLVYFNRSCILAGQRSCLQLRNIIWNGYPTHNAVGVSRLIVIRNSDFLMPGVNLTKFSTNTQILDLDAISDFYHLVELRLTLWRM